MVDAALAPPRTSPRPRGGLPCPSSCFGGGRQADEHCSGCCCRALHVATAHGLPARRPRWAEPDQPMQRIPAGEVIQQDVEEPTATVHPFGVVIEHDGPGVWVGVI